jgi:hypothetical protein
VRKDLSTDSNAPIVMRTFNNSVSIVRDALSGRLANPFRHWVKGKSERKTIYVHIGAHKTGTTSIQAALAAAAPQLRWRGVYFDRSFYQLGKYLAQASPLPDHERERLRDETSNRLRVRPEPTIIGSSEAFFGDLFRSYANIGAVAEDLRAILAGNDVHLVACVRQQDDFVQSVYQQHVKEGGTQSFASFIQSHDIHAYRWNELLSEYRSAFGADALSVHWYEQLFQTPDVLSRLFKPLVDVGLQPKCCPARRNPSLSGKGVEILLRCNNLVDDSERRLLRRFVEDNFSRRRDEPHGLFTRAQRLELLSFYAASNESCTQQFIERSGRTEVLDLWDIPRRSPRASSHAVR